MKYIILSHTCAGKTYTVNKYKKSYIIDPKLPNLSKCKDNHIYLCSKRHGYVYPIGLENEFKIDGFYFISVIPSIEKVKENHKERLYNPKKGETGSKDLNEIFKQRNELIEITKKHNIKSFGNFDDAISYIKNIKNNKREELIKKELIKTTGYINYNKWQNRRTDFGYHSFNIDEINIRGQRIPKDRINKFKKFVDFNNKVILDIGCNVGGMIFHLPEIKYGYGLDFDKNVINAALNIQKILKFDKSKFYVFDFDKDEYLQLDNMIKYDIDIIFLLAVGKWIKNTQKLLGWCVEKKSKIIMEVNNDKIGEPHLNFFRKNGYNIILISNNSDDDIRKENHHRKTYLIEKNND